MSPREELLVAQADPIEVLEEGSLRPTTLADFVGQPELVDHLDIVLSAAKKRGQSVDHLLFAGPPGLGKTTLAGIIANEMGAGMRITSGPAIARAGDLAALLTDLNEGDVLFIDEIHRLARPVEEILYPAMEDSKLDIVIGKGPAARSLRLDLPHFTLVGATTRSGLMTGPLRDRFGFIGRLEYYDDKDLQHIVVRAASILDVDIIEDGAYEIARRSRGTPRIANRLLKRVRDFADVRGDGTISLDMARNGLQLFGIDDAGLDKIDRQLLQTLCERFNGGPVGVATLAVSLGEETETIEDVYEPYLLTAGFMKRTSRGREALGRAYTHLGMIPPETPAALFGD